MLDNRNHESWTVPAQQKPPAAKLKRIGPKPQFEPIKYKPKQVVIIRRVSKFTKREKEKLKRNRKRTVWTPELIGECMRMLDQGLSAMEIGERIGKSGVNVEKQLRRAGCKHVNLIPPEQRKPTSVASRWTQDKVQMIREMCAAGKPAREIAEEFGCSQYIIYSVIRYHSIPHQSAFATQKARGRWTKEDDATLMRLSKEGKGLKDIAAEMGRSVSSISNRRLRLKRKIWSTSH